MGAWGFGPFENDDALDGLGDLVDGIIELEAFLGSTEFLEAPEASVLVAVGAVVVGERPYDENEEDFDRFAQSLSREQLAKVRERLLVILDADKSELYELWAEAGEPDFVEWKSTIQDIIQKWPA